MMFQLPFNRYFLSIYPHPTLALGIPSRSQCLWQVRTSRFRDILHVELDRDASRVRTSFRPSLLTLTSLVCF